MRGLDYALDYSADFLAYATDRNREVMRGRRVLLNGEDVTKDALAFGLLPGREAVLLVERPAHKGPDGQLAKRLVRGDVYVTHDERAD